MGRYVRALLRQLAQRTDVDLTLLVRDPHEAAAYRAIVGASIAVASLGAARRSHRYDRVWYPWNGMRFASNAPALVTINDDFAFAYPARGAIARWREQHPIRTAVREAASVLTISAWSREMLGERFGLDAQRIGVLPLRPDAFFTPAHESSPFHEPFILAVGLGEVRKNIPFLIDAFEAEFAQGAVRLVLVGNPSPALTARIRAAAQPISLVQPIDDARLRRLYRTAAVVAVPSLAEGFGLVAAEAQACGAAVVAANTSALPEAVGNAGILLDPADLPAWRSALRRLIDDAALRAHYCTLATQRWSAVSGRGLLDALLVALERGVDDRP